METLEDGRETIRSRGREWEAGVTASKLILPWYAIQVWSRQEQTIASLIASKGFETFAPCYSVLRSVSGRKRKVELALFPGYIFCRMDPRLRLPIITAPGVIAILGNGKQAIPVNEEEILSIQRAVASGLKAEPCGALKTGEKVRLEGGPLAGLEGLVISEQGKPRLIVSVTLLNRSVSVEIEQDWVTFTHRVLPPVLLGEGASRRPESVRK